MRVEAVMAWSASVASLWRTFVRDDWPVGRRWLFVALGVFALLSWAAVAPHGINASWRECDTQAIARNFVLDGFDLARPRVDWRGDGDGAVECEFPLYQALIALVLRFAGDVEWPGRVLSLVSVLFAAFALHSLLAARSGARAALAGTLVFLVSGQAWLLSSRVTPDALSLALATAGVVTYLRYLAQGSSLALVLSALALAFAALQKPTALQAGLLLLLWTVALAPQRLREPRLWFAAVSALALVVAWLVHGALLHAETGLTFGVISGGDTKFPGLEQLFTLEFHRELAKASWRYGLSVFGIAALAVLAWRRALDRTDVALLSTVAVALLGTLRYSHESGMGAHYHAFAALAGSFFVARAWPERASLGFKAAFACALAVHGGAQFLREMEFKEDNAGASILAVAALVRDCSAPQELVAVRALKPAHDVRWERRNNFEDPRVLYHAHRRGWVLPSDGLDVPTLEGLVLRGARVVVLSAVRRSDEALLAWLALHADRVGENGGALVYRLRSPT
jgi:hypothetical protein